MKKFSLEGGGTCSTWLPREPLKAQGGRSMQFLSEGKEPPNASVPHQQRKGEFIIQTTTHKRGRGWAYQLGPWAAEVGCHRPGQSNEHPSYQKEAGWFIWSCVPPDYTSESPWSIHTCMRVHTHTHKHIHTRACVCTLYMDKCTCVFMYIHWDVYALLQTSETGSLEMDWLLGIHNVEKLPPKEINR